MSENEVARSKARQRVLAGIEFLDTQLGEDWKDQLDRSKMDISSGDMCILGELYGDYHTGCKELGLAQFPSDEEYHPELLSARNFGFFVDSDASDDPEAVDFAYLQDAWAEILDEGIQTAKQVGLEHDYEDLGDDEYYGAAVRRLRGRL